VTAPRRAGAAENRARILAAAREELASDADVRLNAIAQRAGVGQGTLYRHFPTREDLLAEVYRADVDELAAAAATMLGRLPPLDALRGWFDRVADHVQVKRDVFAAVEAATRPTRPVGGHGPIGDAITLLLDAGKAAGTVRPDVDARDLVILIGYLSRLGPAEFALRARHLLRIVLDGVRA
jgi:AcrR family transcriptional regulator